MGVFFNRPQSSSDGQQIPDRLAAQASISYGNQQFAVALDAYAEVVDKIHTMCVVAPPSSRIRWCGPHDQPILDGLINSLGAALAVDPAFHGKDTVQHTVNYLLQIGDAAGDESRRYIEAARQLEFELRHAGAPS